MRARRPMIAPIVGDIGVVVNGSGSLTPVVVVCVYRRGKYQVRDRSGGQHDAGHSGWLKYADDACVKVPRDDEEAQMCRDFLEVTSE